MDLLIANSESAAYNCYCGGGNTTDYYFHSYSIINDIPQIIQAGIQLLVSLIKNLPTIIIEIVKAVPQIIAALVRAFSSSIGQMVQVGGNLIKGLWQGISDAGAWLWSKISGFFGGIVDKIKDFFGIHSPSTLFAGLGANMGEGIGVGFEKAMNSVSKDMQNAIPTDFDINEVNVGQSNIIGKSANSGSGLLFI